MRSSSRTAPRLDRHPLTASSRPRTQTPSQCTFLHRPPGLCLGSGHRPDAGRRRRRLHAADPQYPPIAPPAVSITVTYPGASAETVQSTVVQPIEQQLSGLDHLLYFSAESDKDGSLVITLDFDQGTNPDIAQVQVQNKLQLAEPRLPEAGQQQGIQVAKATKNFLVVVGFVSTDNSMNSADLGDFIASSVQDSISRTNGVGDYQLFGAQYAMRVWLDPAKLDNFALTPSDVSAAILAQNVQVAAGELGGLPAVPSAARCNHHRSFLSEHAGAVRRHPAEGGAERCEGAATRRGADRAGRRQLLVRTNTNGIRLRPWR